MLACYKKAVAVRDLLANEARWTTGAYAKDSGDLACDVDSHYAEKFCIGGAIMRQNTNELWNLMSRTCFETYDTSFAQVNDNLGHEAIMNILNKVVCVAALAPHRV